MVLVSACAQMAPLTGGKRDETPPRLVGADPPERSAQVSPLRIVLDFDEYVQLKNLSGQLMVTPRMDPEPEIAAEGKKVVVEIDSKALLPNTTYRILFGDAIADMNESNSIKGFSYVFSTGSSIDTLLLRTAVKDAFSGSPVGDAVAMLYETTDSDSAVFLKKPAYAAKVVSGTARFENLPDRKFRLYVISDQNRNGVYDGATERVAFSPAPVVPAAFDSAVLKLPMFREEVVKGFVKSAGSPLYGVGQVVLNRKQRVLLKTVRPRDSMRLLVPDQQAEKDTVSFFYRDIQDTLKLSISFDSPSRTDTFNIAVPLFSKKRRIRPSTNIAAGKLTPGVPISLSFNAWMDTIRTDVRRIALLSKDDTLISDRPLAARWRSVREFELSGQLKEGAVYSLKIDTAAFTDVQGLTNDSSHAFFKYLAKQEFGNLTVNVLLPLKQSYVCQLTNSQGNVVREEKLLPGLASSSRRALVFRQLIPADYSLRVIFDNNSNGRWDTGDLMRKVQPERVFHHAKPLQVVADWETEEEVNVRDE
jgi:hypothetical protein